MAFKEMALLLATVFALVCPTGGKNYVQCFKVTMHTEKTLTPELRLVARTITKKGAQMSPIIPLSNVYQRISSRELFKRDGYPMNTVCEYHFTVSKTSKLKFTKIHLDNGVNDKNGNGRLQVCKAVSRAEFKDRDFISLNINHPNNVFCGRPQKEINRRIREDNVPNNHLIITFWSDASYSGEGFDGYFLNLRKRPNRNDLPNEKFGPRGDIGNITWRALDESMDRLNMSLLDDKKIDGNTDEPREMELLMEWLINQSCPIAGNENFPPLKDDQIVTGNHSQAMDETDRKSASVITRSTNAACQMMYPTDSAIGTTTPEPKTEKTIATFEETANSEPLSLSTHTESFYH
ncbi:uncharacterized protein LOC134195530 [Corticium candelabrum]|uniref:uncharacterized protein LOC134195530 n=1 Tax=Corticium candelabrum TaxID=121492 RepID=UPI002E25A3F6|nr:uncharacterized protein LOC134195530 [Corticium candelabrum]